MTTKIQWTGETWNPTTGCDRISPGCDNCYALTMAKRLKAMGVAKYQTDGDPRTSGPGFGLAVHPDALDIPLKWKRPRMVFVNSMSDMFHDQIPLDFMRQVWDVMERTPQHTYQVLTKRARRLPKVFRNLDGRTVPLRTLPNVWLGVSIESDRYVFRANHLRNTPAAVRFLSLEPLLESLPSLDLMDIDWVIIGCESGRGARPFDLDWARDLRDRCAESGTAFFVKQLPGERRRSVLHDMEQFPEDVRIREYPRATEAKCRAPYDRARVAGKIEGVKLALDYLRAYHGEGGSDA